MNRFAEDCGRYPDSSEGLEALDQAPGSLAYRWHGSYLNKLTETDAWAHPYVYRSEKGEDFNLTSWGADGIPGGDDLTVEGH